MFSNLTNYTDKNMSSYTAEQESVNKRIKTEDFTCVKEMSIADVFNNYEKDMRVCESSNVSKPFHDKVNQTRINVVDHTVKTDLKDSSNHGVNVGDQSVDTPNKRRERDFTVNMINIDCNHGLNVLSEVDVNKQAVECVKNGESIKIGSSEIQNHKINSSQISTDSTKQGLTEKEAVSGVTERISADVLLNNAVTADTNKVTANSVVNNNKVTTEAVSNKLIVDTAPLTVLVAEETGLTDKCLVIAEKSDNVTVTDGSRVVYIYSDDYLNLCDRMPKVPKRVNTTQLMCAL